MSKFAKKPQKTIALRQTHDEDEEQVNPAAIKALKDAKAKTGKVAPSKPKTAAKTKAAPKKASNEDAAPRKSKGVAIEAGKEVLPVREGTKVAIMLDTLADKNGATVEELSEALSETGKPWDDKAVKAGFYWDVKNKGYGVRTEQKEGKPDRYFLVFPKGVKEIAFKEAAAKKAA